MTPRRYTTGRVPGPRLEFGVFELSPDGRRLLVEGRKAARNGAEAAAKRWRAEAGPAPLLLADRMRTLLFPGYIPRPMPRRVRGTWWFPGPR